MDILEFIASCLAGSNHFIYIAESIIEVKYSYFFTFFSNSNFVLLLHSCIVDESWMAFLQLDEGDMLMDRLLNERITLMMLFHQHD